MWTAVIPANHHEIIKAMNPTLQIISGILAGAILLTGMAYLAYRILSNGWANKDAYDRREETAFRNAHDRYIAPKPK